MVLTLEIPSHVTSPDVGYLWEIQLQEGGTVWAGILERETLTTVRESCCPNLQEALLWVAEHMVDAEALAETTS